MIAIKQSASKLLSRTLSENGSKRSYYLLYTLSFLLLALPVFASLLLQGKSLIWQSDGWYQHYRALAYYGAYLRQIVRNLLSQGRLVIPDWNFSIGEGSDVMNALHYYVMGDPLALLSALVPQEGTHILLSVSNVLRLYLAGLAFSALAFGVGKRNRVAILTAALSYCFCTWTLLTAARHPYFLNPMIYFPWMILGIEKLIRRERPYVFISAAAISAASNFYFFYMIAILAVVYALVRLAFLYRHDLKTGFLTLLHMGVMALIGVCIAGAILAPVILIFLSDSRAGIAQPFHLFYPLSHYSALPSALISHDSIFWLGMGYSAPVVLSMFSLFLRRRTNTLLKTLLGICAVIVIFPILGRLLNGMGYMSNRWSWALALLCCYILTAEWEHLFSLSRREWRILLGCCAGFYALCFFSLKSHNAAALSALPLLFLALIAVRWPEPGARPLVRQLCLLAVAVASVIRLATWFYAPNYRDYGAELLDNDEIQEMYESDEATLLAGIDREKWNPFPRFTGRSLSPNANLSAGVSSTQYYWTVSNPYVNQFRMDMAMLDPLFSKITGYDDRSTLVALSASQYYVSTSKNKLTLPYGLGKSTMYNTKAEKLEEMTQKLLRELGTEELTELQEKRLKSAVGKYYYVYKNPYALPLSYCYEHYVTQETWDSLDTVQRQELMLRAALVSEAPQGLSPYAETMPDYRVPYSVSLNSQELTETETGFLSTAKDTSFTLKFDPVPDAEIYLRLEGIDVRQTPVYELYFGDRELDPQELYTELAWDMLTPSQQRTILLEKRNWNEQNTVEFTVKSSVGATKYISWKTPDASFSSGRRDFIVNLGSHEAADSITVTLPVIGAYDFSAVTVYAVPMEGFPDRVAELGRNSLEQLRLDTDYLSGHIYLDQPKLLTVAIPYSAGWTALVDGAEAPVLTVNGHYLGLALEPGYHVVELRYATPFKRLGFLLSALGFAALAVTILVEERRRRRKHLTKKQERR